MNKFFKEILSNAEPDNTYSMTKFAVLVALCLWTAQIGTAIWIMVSTKVIDHIVIGEVVAFTLTLLGYKNNFGFIKGDTSMTANVEQPPAAEGKSPKEVL